jgi:ribosomal protein S18 acetylase RimI-like enzyme
VIRVAHVDEDVVDEVREIERACLVETGRENEAGPVNLTHHDPEVWLAYDGEHAVGFGVLVERPANDWCPGWFLRMSGVRPEYQGHGLQRRLIRARLEHARRHGAREVFTYTRPDNAESMRALMSCGFKPYRPENAYAGEGYVYWRRRFT